MEEGFKLIDNYLMVKMPEEIDHHMAEYIREAADNYIISGKVENIVFDFSDTHFMDSSGIGLIMGRYKKISCFGGQAFAIHTDERIKKIIFISGLHKILKVIEEE